MNVEGLPSNIKEQPLDIQGFLNSPSLDIPESRRDISKIENVGWLVRNLRIRNDVPDEVMKKLREMIP